MKEWYQNRMEKGVSHRGFGVPKDQYLLLTEAQAQVHNKNGTEQRVAKAETTPKKDQVAVLADWTEFQSTVKSTSKYNEESPKSKLKSQK